MSSKIDRLEEELGAIRRELDDLRADNLRKDETIQRLTTELKASSLLPASTFTMLYCGSVGLKSLDGAWDR